MSKSILVIDTPKNCRECPCHFMDMIGITGDGKEKFFKFFCGAKNREITEKVNANRQDWCPLRDLPEKMAEESRWFSEDYAKGFNACIDKILKGADGDDKRTV